MSPSRPPERKRSATRAVEPESAVACPHCGSTDVEVEAPFGSQLMTSQYWCRGCRTVFEHVKVDADEAPGAWLER
jgi:transposase-like protein